MNAVINTNLKWIPIDKLIYLKTTEINNLFSRRSFHITNIFNSKYHEILGVPKTATTAEIKAAYLRKCMQLHPDKNDGDKQKHEEFLQLNKAYDILCKNNRSPELLVHSPYKTHRETPIQKDNRYKKKVYKESDNFKKNYGYKIFFAFLAFHFVYYIPSYYANKNNKERSRRYALMRMKNELLEKEKKEKSQTDV